MSNNTNDLVTLLSEAHEHYAPNFFFSIPSFFIGGGFWRSVFAYAFTFLFAWWVTSFTYWGFNQNNKTDRTSIIRTLTDRRDTVTADYEQAFDGDAKIDVLQSLNNPLDLDVFQKAGGGDVYLFTFSSRIESAESERYRDELVFSLTREDRTNSSSPPEFATPDFVFFSINQEASPFSFTYAIESPASVHAFEKGSISFLDSLGDAEITNFDEDEAERAIEGLNRIVKRQVSDVASNSSALVARRLNGQIQAATVICFFAIAFQFLCRAAVFYWCELTLRKHQILSRFWLIQEEQHRMIGTEDLKRIVASMEKIRERCRKRLLYSPCFIELYRAAGAAYLVAGDYQAVPAFVQANADDLAEDRAASSNFIRYLIWAIPTIGFVGTVVGIGAALSETVNVDSLDKAVAAIAKSNVSSKIGIAFDTTLVALVLSLVGMLLYHLMLQLEQRVLVQAKDDAIFQFIKPSESVNDKQLARLLFNQMKKFNESSAGLHSLLRQHSPATNRMKENGPPIWIWFLVGLSIVVAIAALLAATVL